MRNLQSSPLKLKNFSLSLSTFGSWKRNLGKKRRFFQIISTIKMHLQKNKKEMWDTITNHPHFSLPGKILSPVGLPVTGISSNRDFTQPMLSTGHQVNDLEKRKTFFTIHHSCLRDKDHRKRVNWNPCSLLILKMTIDLWTTCFTMWVSQGSPARISSNTVNILQVFPAEKDTPVVSQRWMDKRSQSEQADRKLPDSRTAGRAACWVENWSLRYAIDFIKQRDGKSQHWQHLAQFYP